MMLWQSLRNNQLAGCKFRRQHEIGKYAADFVCIEKKLIIEVDGGQHAVREEYDKERTDFLNKEGYAVVRFWNTEVLLETEAVLEKIYSLLRPLTPTLSPCGGEGARNDPLLCANEGERN